MYTITNYTQNVKALYLLSFLFCLLFISCNNDDDNEVLVNYPIEVEYEVVGKGEHIGISSEYLNTNFIIDNNDTWNEIISYYTAQSINDFFHNNIDFQTHTVIGINDDLKPSIPVNIIINSVMEEKNEITLKYSIDNPGGYATVASPFIFVKIPKTTKPIEFIEE